MAEEHEQRNGRMLFTDLDASDKGRPAVALDYDAGSAETSGADDNFLLKPIPTIQDLASSLELDFEDDWGSADEDPPSAAAGDDAGGDAAASPPHPENAVNRPGAPADAVTVKDRRPSAPPPRPAGSGITERLSAKPSATAAGHVTPGADGIPENGEHPGHPRLSAAADALEPRLPSVSADPIADAFAHRPEPEARPFYDILDDGDEELDILSLLSPTADGAFEGHWRGGRLGLDAPRERPYGGIKRLDEWYVPPAEPEKPVADDLVDLLDKMGGWHQPPERTGSSDDTDAYPPAQEHGDSGASADADADVAGAAAPSEAAPAIPSDTRRLDMFSDMDLDALWEEKLRQPQDSGDSRSTRVITRALDMFDDIDLDTIWDEKRRRAEAAAGETDRPRPPTPPDESDAASTMILGRDLLENSATVIMPRDNRLQNAETPVSRAERRSPPPPGGPAAKDERAAGPPSAVGGDALSFLDDLDAFAADGDASGAPFQKRPSGQQASAAPGELDLADLMSMVEDEAPGVDASVRPPVIGDDDIMEINGGFETQSQEESRAAAGRKRRRVKKKADSAASSAAAQMDGAGADAEQDYIPADDGGDLPAEAGLDLDGIAAADDGDPVPFIDDSMIAPPEEEEAEPDPEGLDALLARENARLAEQLAEEDEKAKVWHGAKTLKKKGDGEEEDEEADEEEEEDGDEAGGEEGEESAAVNPMDVFSNMDALDFDDGDGLDDEMKAMLDDDPEAGEAEGESTQPEAAAMAETPPDGFMARIRFYARRALRKIIPQSLIDNLAGAIAWRENWWFYCDLMAAIITSASLAVIISYYIWYKK